MPKYVLYNTVAQPYYLLYVFCLCNDLAIDPSAPRSDDTEDLFIVRTSRRGGGAGSHISYIKDKKLYIRPIGHASSELERTKMRNEVA